jgi:hypothetical protein
MADFIAQISSGNKGYIRRKQHDTFLNILVTTIG